MVVNLKDIEWKEFKTPPKFARPMVRWWWTGCDVEKDELIREIQELDEQGFLGAEIQVFMIGSPVNLEKIDKERAVRSHRFMQPFYYEIIKFVLDEACKRDMIIDLTVGSSWPIGGVHISKEESMKALLIGQKIIKGPMHFVGDIPQFVIPPSIGLNVIEYSQEDMKLVAVTAAKPIGKLGEIKFNNIETAIIDKNSILDLTDKVNDSNILEWDVPDGDWQIFAFYYGPSGASPLADCRSSVGKQSLVINHLSSEPIRRHLDLHLGEGMKYFGNHFGKTLRSFFTDSLELSSDWLWTDDFLDQFRKRRGYDLRPFLPVCFVPGRDNKYAQINFGGDVPAFDFEGNIGERIRFDFEKTISDLFCDEFVQTMTNWANENKLKSRIQAYGIRVDTLKAYGIAHIPETEQLYGGGAMDFLKLAGSAGIINKKQIVTAESIVWNQRDYMTTPLKWKVAADRLFASGINQMIYHGFSYQNPLYPYPGYCGFSNQYLPSMMNFSSNFSRINPFWKFFPILNMYVTRCQYILQHGKTECNAAIFYPVFNYCDSVLKKEELTGGYLDENDAPMPKGAIDGEFKRKDNYNSNDLWTLILLKLGDNLSSNGFYYVHVNEESLLKSTINKNKLIIGDAIVEVLILPSIDQISVEIAEKLKEIAISGIPIILLNKIPDRQPGFLNYEENDEKIKDILYNLIETKKVHFLDENHAISAYLTENLRIKPGIIFDSSQPSINYIHKSTENSDYYFLRNSNNQPRKVSIKFSHSNKIPFILNPWTGKINQAAQYKSDKDYVKMDLYFESYGSIIIEFKEAKEKLHILESPLRAERINGEIVSYSDNSGEYLIKISDGTKKNININKSPFSSLKFTNWHLKTNLRDHLGNTIPIEMNLEELKDWCKIPELKYCSSKGIYTSKFILDENFNIPENLKLVLCLGRVHDVAIIRVNKFQFQPLLVYPYEIDITTQIKRGENIIEIEIIPTLRNRLNGYGKVGGKNWKNHKRRKIFMPSGLIGPVTIKSRYAIKIKSEK